MLERRRGTGASSPGTGWRRRGRATRPRSRRCTRRSRTARSAPTHRQLLDKILADVRDDQPVPARRVHAELLPDDARLPVRQRPHGSPELRCRASSSASRGSRPGSACTTRRRWRSCCGRRSRPTRSRPGSSRGSCPPSPIGGVETIDGPGRARLGRGVLPGLRLDPVRSDRRRRRPCRPSSARAQGAAPQRGAVGLDRPGRPRPDASPGRDAAGRDVRGDGPAAVSASARCSSLLAVLLAVVVGTLAFAAWLRGPRGDVTPDAAWSSMSRAAGRFGFGPRPTQTVYEYATALGDARAGREGRTSQTVADGEGRDGLRGGVKLGGCATRRGRRRDPAASDHAAPARVPARRASAAARALPPG